MLMRTESDDAALCEDALPYFIDTGSGNPPAVILNYAPAGNDDTCIDDVAATLDLELWARRASTSSGFGDAGAVANRQQAATRGTLPIDAPHGAARRRRARAVVRLIVLGFRRIARLARRAHARFKQRRQMAEVVAELEALDDHTLHDLGFHRSEISSIGAEVTGEADCTRVRTLATLYGLPR